MTLQQHFYEFKNQNANPVQIQRLTPKNPNSYNLVTKTLDCGENHVSINNEEVEQNQRKT